MSGSTREGVHVELYVRSLAPRGVRPRQEAVIDTLDYLRECGKIQQYTVHVCGKQAPATPSETRTEFGKFLLNRVAVFYEWADTNGWSLGSLFERRTVNSSLTGENQELLVLPVMALAEYEGSDLRFVAPCRADDTEWTVENRLDTLRSGRPLDTAERLPDAHARQPATTPTP